MNNINLLPKGLSDTENRFPKLIRMIAIGFLSLVSFLAILFFFLKSQSSLPSLQEEETQLVNQLNTLNVKTAKYFFIKDRLAKTTQLLAIRPALEKTIQTVEGDLVPNIRIEGLSTDKTKVQIRYTTKNISALNAFMNTIETKTVKYPMFKSLTLENLSYDEKNTAYSISLMGILK